MATCVPIFQTSIVREDVKFLNGIRKRSSDPIFHRSGRDQRFGTKSPQHQRRVVFNDLELLQGFDHLKFERKRISPELNENDPREQPRLKPSGMSSWSKRIPLRVAGWESDRRGRRVPDEQSCFARSHFRPMADRCERTIVFDPGRIRSDSPIRVSTRAQDRECAHQTLLAGVSRNAST